MAKKRAIIGFKNITLLPVTKNTAMAYAADGTPISIPYAGSMSRTVIETTQELYYDDDLYARVRDVKGEEVEIRVAEVELPLLGALGLGKWDEAAHTLEADYATGGKEYALRCMTTGIHKELPYYFKWRLFTLDGIKFDNFNTKGSKIQVCEVIIAGTLGRPLFAALQPYTITAVKDDTTNAQEALRVLTEPEVYG